MDLLLSVLILTAVPFLVRFGWYAGKLLAYRWFDK